MAYGFKVSSCHPLIHFLEPIVLGEYKACKRDCYNVALRIKLKYDAIKQNKSEGSQIQHSFFWFLFSTLNK